LMIKKLIAHVKKNVKNFLIDEKFNIISY